MRPKFFTLFKSRNLTWFLRGICSATFLLGIICYLGISTPAHASGSDPVIGLQPAYFNPKDPISRSYFIFNSNPGAHIQNAIRVTNSGSVAGRATLYGTDATTGTTSGAIYLDRTAQQQDIGSWLTLGKSSLVLAPGQSVLVPFKVTLPTDVRSGQHLGGIGMEVTPLNPVKLAPAQGNKVQIQTRIITVIAVQVNLPGTPIEQLSASGIVAGGGGGYQSLQISLHNTGTVMLKPSGTLQVMDGNGALLQTVPLKLDTVLPMTSIQYPVYLKKALNVGSYQMALTLNYGTNQVLNYNTHFTVTAQQIQQAFPAGTTLPAPAATSSSVPVWMFVAGGFFILCGLLFLVQQSRRFALNARGRNKDKEGSHV